MSILPHDAPVSIRCHCRLALSLVCGFLCGLWKCQNPKKSQCASFPQNAWHWASIKTQLWSRTSHLKSKDMNKQLSGPWWEYWLWGEVGHCWQEHSDPAGGQAQWWAVHGIWSLWWPRLFSVSSFFLFFYNYNCYFKVVLHLKFPIVS